MDSDAIDYRHTKHGRSDRHLAPVDRDAIIRDYLRNRARTRALFDLLDEDAYYSRPIPLRHPLVFYEGHLPAFSFNTLVRRALGEASIDTRLETLFARGIDPHESQAAARTGNPGRIATWSGGSPTRPTVASSPPWKAPISSGRGIRCSIAPRRCSRSWSMKSCTRKR